MTHVLSQRVLLFWIIILIVYVIWATNYRVENFSVEDGAIKFRDQHILSSGYNIPKVALLLQQSPVAPVDQFKRLQAIDVGWAVWSRRSKSNAANMFLDIYAPQLPNTTFSTLQNILIRKIRGSDPFERMISLFLSVLLQGDVVYDWIVFGNDHSFFIPPNLQCFLNGMDEEDVIYSGNKLGVMYGNKFIKFASGGAGVVLSRTSLLAVLVTWTALHPLSIAQLLQDLHIIDTSSSSTTSQHEDLCADHRLVDFSLSRSPSELAEAFLRLLQWNLTPPACKVSIYTYIYNYIYNVCHRRIR